MTTSLMFQQVDLSAYLSLAFLFGIAAQFKAMDGYTFLRRLITVLEARIGILYSVIFVTSIFSPFILNDVVVIILTPVIIRYAKQFKVDMVPLLVAKICFTNIASSLTPFGNPQNILLWSATGVNFVQFVAGTWFPLFISGTIVVLVLLPFARSLSGTRGFPITAGSMLPAVYLGIITLIIVLSDLIGLPPYISLGAAFLLGFLFTFGTSRQGI